MDLPIWLNLRKIYLWIFFIWPLRDSHNLIIVGTSPEDMLAAADEVSLMGGGLVVVRDKKVLAGLPLPVAGLMSDKDAFTVANKLEELHRAAKEIGCILPEPFMTISFLALPVIPELKITDCGLVDVNAFSIVELWTE